MSERKGRSLGRWACVATADPVCGPSPPSSSLLPTVRGPADGWGPPDPGRPRRPPRVTATWAELAFEPGLCLSGFPTCRDLLPVRLPPSAVLAMGVKFARLELSCGKAHSSAAFGPRTRLHGRRLCVVQNLCIAAPLGTPPSPRSRQPASVCGLFSPGQFPRRQPLNP